MLPLTNNASAQNFVRNEHWTKCNCLEGGRQYRLHPAQLRGDEQAVGPDAAPGPQQGAGAKGEGEDGT